ncbi:putative selection and upkeep of intraepithelial T-cells protein 1 homolog [Tupaia chinensis]|uniref:putative selection and upkeep of intraepithelial T-cells protein 1 homolog n=1 Tax=Tupaia chinensis TaxID=246437 RepID=UPI0003C8CF30|nr:putative selection and upkeep of intraepithelial T-cells protein 1 homolog [Tupaia chinensis]
MMNLKFSSFSGTYVGFILLQVITLTSEHFMVTISTGHLVAMVGGQAELSCQLFPPQDAEHMEVRWFRSDHSKPIYLYRDGHDMKGEIAPEYVHRTEFVKEAIREGKVTLRIHNISISDDGPYQCLFKDGGFSEASSMNLSVAAVGLETQIYVEPLFSDACMVECHSGGWFPQPQMEWRDDRGEVVPHSSKLPSQDGARFFHMKMTVVLTNNSQGNITCYIHNPLTGEVKQTRIILSNGLFESDYIWIVFLGLLLGIVLVCIAMHLYILLSIKKVSIPDPLFLLYSDWMWDMAIVVFIMVAFFTILIFILYLTVKGHKITSNYKSDDKDAFNKRYLYPNAASLRVVLPVVDLPES